MADKTAELCLFYNLALNRVNDLVRKYEKDDTLHIEDVNWETFGGFRNVSTYLHLQVFMWKEPLSASFTTLSTADKKRIHELLRKLVDLRNYQSHYYHDASVLKFPQELIDFIYSRYANARNALELKYPEFVTWFHDLNEDKVIFKNSKGEEREDVYRHFYFFNANGNIEPEGKNFFLSFFLLKGEMSKFLKKRSRCKRDNGEKYQVKTRLYTYYCHRDGSNRFFLEGKEEYMDTEERLRRQGNTLLNYLKSRPLVDLKYLPPAPPPQLLSKKEVEERKNRAESQAEEEKTYIRRTDKFASLVVRYFMDRAFLGYEQEPCFYWHVKSLDLEEVQKQKQENRVYDAEGAYYYQKESRWSPHFVPGEFPVFVNGHIKFRLGPEGMEYAISTGELKNMLYLLLNSPRKNMTEIQDALLRYGTQFSNAMRELTTEHNIRYEAYPLVFEKGRDSVLLSKMHRKVLDKEKFDAAIYTAALEKALDSRLRWVEYNCKPEVYTLYTRNRMNRILLSCFNWYLPDDAKLKPTEVNKLSIYNFVSDNSYTSDATRESIVVGIQQKLNRAQFGAFALLRTASGLQDAYLKMLGKLRDSLLVEKQQLLAGTHGHVLKLGARLGLALPGTDVSRNGTDRMQELKQTIRSKPILVRNGFFKQYFMPEEPAAARRNSISARLWKNRLLTQNLVQGQYKLQNQSEFINHPEYGLADIAPDILALVGDHFDACMMEHTQGSRQTFAQLVDRFEALYTGSKSPEKRKQIADAINYSRVLKEIQAQDALLLQVFFEYHNRKLPLNRRELKYKPLSTLFEEEYELQIDASYKVQLKYKQLDDLSTHWNRTKIEQLFKNEAYWNLAIIAELDAKGKKSMQEKIRIVMDRVWNDSYHYIKAFLHIEKEAVEIQKKEGIPATELISRSQAIRSPGLPRIEGKVLLSTFAGLDEGKINRFIQLRNAAFHAGIPEECVKYEKVKDDLYAATGVKKPVVKPKKYEKKK